mmetsp:Transcript_133972/g.260917  ORF Transcript_133972/g.260917 Transcript_133972/m.260917 type:complete len:216 (-) Transcript_133972:27-674(-)
MILPVQSPAVAPAPEHMGTDRPSVIIAVGIPRTAPIAEPATAPAAPPVTPKTIILQERGNDLGSVRARLLAVCENPWVTLSAQSTASLSQYVSSLVLPLCELVPSLLAFTPMAPSSSSSASSIRLPPESERFAMRGGPACSKASSPRFSTSAISFGESILNSNSSWARRCPRDGVGIDNAPVIDESLELEEVMHTCCPAFGCTTSPVASHCMLAA